jgi:hypothetical protein
MFSFGDSSGYNLKCWRAPAVNKTFRCSLENIDGFETVKEAYV